MANERINDDMLDEVTGGIIHDDIKAEHSIDPNARLKEIVDAKDSILVSSKTDTLVEDSIIKLNNDIQNDKVLKPKTYFLDKLLKKLKIRNLQ